MTIPPLECAVYLLYVCIAVACSVIIAIVLNRIKNTVCKETVDKSLCRLLAFLLAEDNELKMEIANALLTDAGAVASQAFKGKEAVDRFLCDPPGIYDMILMNPMLPVMNGPDAARVAERPDAETIPIPAMTADAFEEDKQQVTEADTDADAHIAKPIDSPVLISMVSRFIPH